MRLTGAIQAAIHAALTAGSPQPVAAGRVYDLGNAPPVSATGDGVLLPYVVIGAWEASASDDKGTETDDGYGCAFTQTFDIWSSAHRGKRDIESVMAAIYAALHDQRLALAGSPPDGVVVLMRWASEDISLDEEPSRMRGSMRFDGTAHTA